MPRFKQSTRRRAQKRASYARHAAARRANQNAANARKKATQARLRTSERLPEGYRIVTHPALIDRPQLKWLDCHGNLHTEYELSAEELIRRHERSNHVGKKQQPKKSKRAKVRAQSGQQPDRRRLRIDPHEARKLLGNRTRTQDTEEEKAEEIIFDLPRPQRLTPEEEKQLCAKCGHDRRAHHAQECVGGWQRDRTDWPRCQCTTYLFEAKQPEVKT